MNKAYHIIDWAGNVMFNNKQFKSFEDGWEYIYTNVDNSLYNKTNNDNDDNYQEYYVMINNL